MKKKGFRSDRRADTGTRPQADVSEVDQKRTYSGNEFLLLDQHPLHEDQSQAHENQRPVHKNQSPAHESQRQVHENQRQVHENQRQVHKNQSPVHKNQSPAHKNQSQAHENQSQTHENQSPAHESQRQVHENQRQVHENQRQVHKNQSPVHKNQSSAHKNQSPAHKNQSPAHEDQSQAHENQSQTHENQRQEHEDQYQEHEDVQEGGDRDWDRKVVGKLHIRCDLCNETLYEDIDLHREEHHATILNWHSQGLFEEGSEVLEMDVPASNTTALGAFVLESVAGLDKGRKVFEVIQRAVFQLNMIVNFSLPGSKVFLFGSCVAFGCWDGVGDADFTVLSSLQLEKMVKGYWEPRKEINSLLNIAGILRSVGFLRSELEPVIRTRVPVVKRKQLVRMPLYLWNPGDKFKVIYSFVDDLPQTEILNIQKYVTSVGGQLESTDPQKVTACFDSDHAAISGFCNNFRTWYEVVRTWKEDHPLPDIFYVDFDISCRPLGLRNSWLMRLYLSQSPEVRAGAAFIKRWSKQCGINNPLKGYLSSYAVTILWVSYLLQLGYVDYVDPGSVSLVPSPSQSCVTYQPLLRKEGDGGKFPGSLAQDLELKATQESLGYLVAEFFRHYAKFSWHTHVVTLRERNGYVMREDLGWVEENEVMTNILRDRVWYRMCIEDPYEDDLNLGRHLSPLKFFFVQAQFVRAFTLVLHGQLGRLLVDERQLANATLHALLHRAVHEGHTGMSLLEAREFFISRSSKEVLRNYELMWSLGSLCDKLVEVYHNLTDDRHGTDGCPLEGDTANADGSASFGEVAKSTGAMTGTPFVCSDLLEVDMRLRAAGRLGISVDEVPMSVRGAYFFACGRAFGTAEERDTLQLHVDAIFRVPLFEEKDEEEVCVAVQDELPAAVRDDDLVKDILHFLKPHIMKALSDTEGANMKPIVRQHVPSQWKRSGFNVVRRGDKVPTGMCSGCNREKAYLWATNNRAKDSGVYCNACWKEYEREYRR